MTRILEITTALPCPTGCDYCPQAALRVAYDGPRLLSYRRWRACLDKLPDDVEVAFAGMAEPWLNPRCTHMILDAAARGTVSLFTTLYHATLSEIKSLADVHFKHFVVHLPDADGRMPYRPRSRYLDVLRECCRQFSPTFAMFGTPHPAIVDIVPSDIGNHEAGLFSRCGLSSPPATEPKSGPIWCASCGPRLDHSVLLPDGRVVLCCMDYGLKHVLGNLETEEYEALFNGAAYRQVTETLQHGGEVICRRCENSRRCDGEG